MEMGRNRRVFDGPKEDWESFSAYGEEEERDSMLLKRTDWVPDGGELIYKERKKSCRLTEDLIPLKGVEKIIEGIDGVLDRLRRFEKV